MSLFSRIADGSRSARPLRPSGSDLRLWPGSWSPDGKTLAFTERDPTDAPTLRLLRYPELTTNEGIDEASLPGISAAFSPDGRWLAYEDWAQEQIYVQPYPGPGGRMQITVDGGHEPVWSRDGRELFLRQDDKLVAVPVLPTPSFRAGRPEVLFEHPYVSDRWTRNYDVGPDGRFLMIQPSVDELTSRPIYIVENWTEELKRRLP